MYCSDKTAQDRCGHALQILLTGSSTLCVDGAGASSAHRRLPGKALGRLAWEDGGGKSPTTKWVFPFHAKRRKAQRP